MLKSLAKWWRGKSSTKAAGEVSKPKPRPKPEFDPEATPIPEDKGSYTMMIFPGGSGVMVIVHDGRSKSRPELYQGFELHPSCTQLRVTTARYAPGANEDKILAACFAAIKTVVESPPVSVPGYAFDKDEFEKDIDDVLSRALPEVADYEYKYQVTVFSN